MFLRLAIVSAVLASGAAVHAKGGACPLPKVSYSAQMKISSSAVPGRAPMIMSAKVFVANKRMRMEMKQGAMEVIAITDQDKKRAVMLMPQMKQYVETRLQQDGFDPLSSASECKLKRLGTEVIAGLKATKYKLTAKAKQVATKGTIWLTKDNIAVKMVGETVHEQQGKKMTVPVSVSLSEVKIGKVPEKLFRVPKGFKKAAIPGMPGGAPPMGK